MNLLPEMIEASCEGNISWFENRQEKLKELITITKPENLIEIGFNIGHSALIICSLIADLKKQDSNYRNKRVDFFVFDICVCAATKHNVEVLKTKFGEYVNLHLIEGSSLETVPTFLKNNPTLFDFIEIDGCHTYDCVRQDVFNTINSLSNKGFIYIDDYKSQVFPITEVDNGVDSIDWNGYETNFVDGVFWVKKQSSEKEMVNHPNHYGGDDSQYEVVKVAEAWDLDKDAYLFNVVKYVARAGKKDKNKELEDLKKASWYLERKIENLEKVS